MINRMKRQVNVGGTTCTNQELIQDPTTNLHKLKEKSKQPNKKIYQKCEVQLTGEENQRAKEI